MTNGHMLSESHESILDHIGAVAVIGVLAEWLPVFVAFLAAVWYMIRIGEWIHDKWTSHNEKKSR